MQTFVIWAMLLSPLGALPPTPVPTETPAPSAQEKGKEIMALVTQMAKAAEQKKWDEALKLAQKWAEKDPKNPEAHYNLACYLARTGKKDEALTALVKAADLGFNESAHMQKDDDLDTLRSDSQYEQALKKVKANDAAGVEKGAELPGVKTVEDSPDSGLPYRLRMSPDATKEKPNRLIVWLHPAGGSMNDKAEALAPRFIKQGFALLVFTKKDFRGWNQNEVPRLANTLQAVGKVEGISLDRPILLGFSAGGQLAFELWASNAAGLGGMILDAAYPFRIVSRTQATVISPPAKETAQKIPLFVVVGLKDGGSQLWKKIEDPYRQAGVPLTIQYVENRGHEWLFGEDELTALDKWLGEAAAAKLPADEKPVIWHPQWGGEAALNTPTGLLKFAEKQTSVSFPIQHAGLLTVTKVKVNGQDSGWFIVDLGAQLSAISLAQANTLKLPITQTGEAHGAGGTTQVNFRKVDTLSAGNLTMNSHAVIDRDFKTMSDTLGLEIGGILGGSLWCQAPFTLDYQAGTITFYDPKEFKPPTSALEEKMELINGRPAIKATLGGKQEVSLILDTAGSRFIYLTDPAIIKENPDLVSTTAARTISTVGISGAERLKLGELKSLQVFGQKFDKVQMQYTEGGKESAVTPDFAGTLGAPFLEHFRLTFDYPNKKIYAEPCKVPTITERLSKGLKASDKDLAGFTPLHTAAAFGLKDDVQKLLAAKADPNAADSIGRTPLHIAAGSGGPEVVKLLLAKGADVKAKAKAGTTPLMAALINNQIDSAQALLAAGAPINVADELGNTPLLQAAATGDLGLVKALLKAKADVTAKNDKDETVLMGAVHGDNAEVIAALIEVKADVNAKDKQGATALMRAAFLGKAKAVEALLAAKADATIKTSTGATARAVAKSRGFDNIVAIFDKAGVKE